MQNEALTYAKTNQAQILVALESLLRLPSVSTLPEHAPDMQHSAQWLADKLQQIGLENVAVMPTAGPPVVYADWLHAGAEAPTLLVYGHYDVQPVDPVEEWLTPPFEPTVKGDYIYCRGATDNKGQLYAHIAAIEAYLESSGQLPVNIKVMLEGEEEIGSPNLEAFVVENQDLLQTDAAIISDSHIADPNTPVIITSVRGLAYLEITLRGSRSDLHSGMYGGVVENPLNAMVKMLAALRDENGRATIPGFYDAVRELSRAEREAINKDAVTAEKVMADIGAPALWGEPEYTIAERIGVRPTLDIHGIKGGFIGAGSKTVIPATASAKVSMRLVPDQDSAEIARLFKAYIEELCPPTMELTITDLSMAEPAVVDVEAPALEAAAEAYEIGFGRRPQYKREGGTLPIVGLINKILNAPVVMMGFGLPDDNLHAPNERYYLPNFYRGIETAIHYYSILGREGR
ncbi:MAG: dipeptidase [Anaerolineae bacterium]|nr:dipeptidase [Anaerolineae bacterium]